MPLGCALDIGQKIRLWVGAPPTTLNPGKRPTKSGPPKNSKATSCFFVYSNITIWIYMILIMNDYALLYTIPYGSKNYGFFMIHIYHHYYGFMGLRERKQRFGVPTSSVPQDLDPDLADGPPGPPGPTGEWRSTEGGDGVVQNMKNLVTAGGFIAGWWELGLPWIWHFPRNIGLLINHPNWRSHIFHRGGPTTNQIGNGISIIIIGNHS